ncbi:MAG: glycosyl transferase [Parcubacteria group bacterium]|nr:MAG: glycosyl transferase [Parcubacteria group bacterium]
MPIPATINIVVPVFNEEAVLEKNILLLWEFAQKTLSHYNSQIIIADNNSRDNTAAIGQRLALSRGIKYFFIPQKGRGLALRKTFLENQADFHVYMDIDLATDLSALPVLVRALVEENYDLVTGSRFWPGSKIKRSLLREIISRGYIFLVKLMFRTKLTDMQCGFKGLNNRTVQNIVSQTKDQEWFFDTELLLLAEKNNYQVKQIPITWIETRNIGRKSKVRLAKDIWKFVTNLTKFKYS